jgi:hypothetical protein
MRRSAFIEVSVVSGEAAEDEGFGRQTPRLSAVGRSRQKESRGREEQVFKTQSYRSTRWRKSRTTVEQVERESGREGEKSGSIDSVLIGRIRLIFVKSCLAMIGEQSHHKERQKCQVHTKQVQTLIALRREDKQKCRPEMRRRGLDHSLGPGSPRAMIPDDHSRSGFVLEAAAI